MAVVTKAELENAQLDCLTLQQVVNSTTGLSATPRLGGTIPTLAGLFASIGYQVPVAFAADISVTTAVKTVVYDNIVYAPVVTALPFTTTGVFNAAQWYPIQRTTLGMSERWHPRFGRIDSGATGPGTIGAGTYIATWNPSTDAAVIDFIGILPARFPSSGTFTLNALIHSEVSGACQANFFAQALATSGDWSSVSPQDCGNMAPTLVANQMTLLTDTVNVTTVNFAPSRMAKIRFYSTSGPNGTVHLLDLWAEYTSW
jgi:hypothetical protein